MDTRFTGVIPPLITPFTQDGAVDLDGLDRVIEDYVDGVMLKDIIDEGDVFFDVDKISQIVAAKLSEEDAE